MATRLDYVKLSPRAVLDAGCGSGSDFSSLAKRYPGVHVLGIDHAFESTRLAARSGGWSGRIRKLIGRSPTSVACADLSHLPLKAECVDLVWCCLALPWLPDPERGLSELWRVLRPGGLLAFCTYGPDTLKELRASFAAVDSHSHALAFADMHDLGDLAVATGFSAPVLDVDLLTLTYESVQALVRDLKRSGQSLPGGRAGLMGRGPWARMVAGYENRRMNGRLPATVELVFGHAWKPEPARKMDFKGIEIRRG